MSWKRSCESMLCCRRARRRRQPCGCFTRTPFLCGEVSTYLGVESPEKRCGKTTFLSVLSELVNRAVALANISSPAVYRAIEEKRPTLLIDEADTFLQGNDELRGILNSGYTRKSAHVIPVINQPPSSSSSS